MIIEQSEEVLFKKWSANRPGFVSDGVVDEDSYLNSKPKIMLLLKEVNDRKGEGGGWDLREFLRNGARSQTWDNVTRWVYGIRNIHRDIKWEEIREISTDQRKEYLKSICAINLKKSPGSHTTDNIALSKIAKEDRIFFNEQFKLYDPELVVCCGSVVGSLFNDLIKHTLKQD